MKANIPKGGFFVVKDAALDLQEVCRDLEEDGYKTILIENESLLLAVFSEFSSQGVFENRDFAIVYDAQITNFSQLSRGEKFTNAGHLIAKLYAEKGPSFLNHLKGAFGFGLWDKNQSTLLTATDSFGVRPVLYTSSAKGVIAGSRIRYIKKYSKLNTSMLNEALFHYLFFSAIPSPVTFYKEILKLEPGKYLIHKNGQINIKRYYDIVYNPDYSKNEAYWKKEIPVQLKKAFYHFFESAEQKQTGCFLSGGTDSSSLVGYCSQFFNYPVKTFSIGFDNEKYNEISYANIASQHFNTEQYDYFVTPDDVIDLINTLPKIYDEPFGNASVVPAYYCAKIAQKNNVELLYGGDGGDEIFGGNERYVANLLFDAYFKIPGLCRNFFLEPLSHILSFIPLVFRAGRYFRRANIPNPERFYSYNLLSEINHDEVFNHEFINSFDTECFMKIAKQHFNSVAKNHITDKLLYLDMKFVITDNDLRKVTQMAEAAGIQVQFPFLDKDLVDFTGTIPPELKVKWGKNRYIFKQAMKGFLPDKIINKSKHGMGLPVTPWFKKDPKMNELLYDTLFTGTTLISEYIKPAFIHRIKASFEKDTTSYYGDNLWVFLVLELWLRESRLIQ